MPKTMLINVTHAEESRVGIVADGVLASFEIETFSRQHLKGNIYKGVVHRIHPALEAAFVDIGADRDAFLPLDEICFRNLPTPPPRDTGNGAEGRRRPRIKEVLKPGEEILVQIVKEEFASKPPTLSTFYSLPGRYLVLLPGSDEAGISRRIEGTERVRIRELIEKLQPPPGFGIIVRTAAGFDEGSRELHRDLSYLLRLWETIKQAAASKRAPALVYREHDLVLRNIRDYFTPDIDEIYIDNEEVCQRAREFLRDVMPGKEHVLHLYQGDQPIFSHFNVETQIESIYKRRVPLPSGGSIVIDGTEALTAIDVNSGRSIRGANQEETAFRTNVEAATEIARQLRLRDLGGLIVIDFIDMRGAQHGAEVEKTLRDAMRQDKARHDIGRISHFGLLEVSRQRLRPAAAATSYTACPMCEGHGLVRTTESAALVALRKIHNRIAQGDVMGLRVSLPPDVAVYVLNQKRDDLAQLERRYAARIQVVLNAALMPHQSEFEVRARVEAGQPEAPQLRLGGVTAAEPAPLAGAAAGNGDAAPEAAPAEGTPPGAEAAVGAKRRRRRRGRRRGRGRQAAAAIGEALAALAAGTSLAQRHDEGVGVPVSSDHPPVAAEESVPAVEPEVVSAASALGTSDASQAPASTDAAMEGQVRRKPPARRARGSSRAQTTARSRRQKQAGKGRTDEAAAVAVEAEDSSAKKRKVTRPQKPARRPRRARSTTAAPAEKSENRDSESDAT
ncbi:MAG TPA: Rne/Rng family ribonuclease [Candidatus Margulisiibacteriota bacterium]|nr:Rne/Rng family ribonuclease [Candidatus Margulisiibacteriota bacterium]